MNAFNTDHFFSTLEYCGFTPNTITLMTQTIPGLSIMFLIIIIVSLPFIFIFRWLSKRLFTRNLVGKFDKRFLIPFFILSVFEGFILLLNLSPVLWKALSLKLATANLLFAFLFFTPLILRLLLLRYFESHENIKGRLMWNIFNTIIIILSTYYIYRIMFSSASLIFIERVC